MHKFTGNPIFYGIITVTVLIIVILAGILVSPLPAQTASASTILGFGEPQSALKTPPPTKTPAPYGSFFTEKFSDPNTLARNWQIVDAKPSWGGPSSWSIKNGLLQQNSGIFYNGQNRFQILEGTNLISKALEPGEFAYKVTFNTNGGKGGVGIIFHYKDEQHYYRFETVQNSGDGGPFRKLQAMVENNFVTLVQNKQGYDPNKSHTVVINVVSDTLSVYFDGKKQFSSPDGHNNANGHVGLQTYANNVTFDNLQVNKP